MLAKHRNSIFWIVCVLSAFFVYWPSLTGTPLWDDFSYWFYHPSTKETFAWTDIWRDFNWPVSVSLQKGLFILFKHNYVGYHVFNILIHIINTILVWVLLGKFKVRFREWIALAFLLHPANVISVAWMIQMKTLVCFTFCALSLLSFQHSMEKDRVPVLAWILFIASILSKSASIVFPLVVLGLYFSHMRTKRLWWFLPFFLISFWGVKRLYSSDVTKVALKTLSTNVITSDNLTNSTETKNLLPSDVIEISDEPFFPADFWEKWPWIKPIILSTVYHYFWQVPVPKNLLPIKNTDEMYDRPINTLHLVFLLTLVILLWNSPGFGFMVGGYVMILPFIGVLSAPYMNITFASDQHLYLAIPFFLAFWFYLVDRISWKKLLPILPLFVLWLGYKSHRVAPWYQDEVVFFDTILMHDPDNVPVAYNLAMTHFSRGNFDQAIEITSSLVEMGQKDKNIRTNRYFPYLVEFHMRLISMRQGNGS